MLIHIPSLLKWFVVLIGISQLAACASPSATLTATSTIVPASINMVTTVTAAVTPSPATNTPPLRPTATATNEATPTSALTPTLVEAPITFDAQGILYEHVTDGSAQRVQPLISGSGEARIAFNGDGSIWFFTDHGVSRVINDRITHFADEPAAIVAAYPWTGKQTLWPVAPDGTLWTIAGGKLLGYNGKTWLSVPLDGANTDAVDHIAAGPDGLLAVTSASGLSVYTP